VPARGGRSRGRNRREAVVKRATAWRCRCSSTAAAPAPEIPSSCIATKQGAEAWIERAVSRPQGYSLTHVAWVWADQKQRRHLSSRHEMGNPA
jgi:hypothetical protein